MSQPIECKRAKRESGVATFITAAALLVLIPIVGLSIDGGYAFVIRSRLSAAMDSAALAAGRGVNLAASVDAAQAQALAQATSFFNANFPSGYMNTSTTSSDRVLNPTFTVNVDSGGHPTGTLTISITGSVVAPTYFMRWLGIQHLTIAALGTATRRNLVMELVLDKSASMGTRNSSVGTMPSSISSSSSPCEDMVYSSNQFVQYFSPYDYLGEISFESTIHDDFASSTNWWQSGSSGMSHAIANIQCGNNTNTTAALYKAYQDIRTANQPLANNVIVLFTDGVPNGVNARFPIRTSADTRLGTAAATPTIPDSPVGNRASCQSDATYLCQNMPACTSTAGFVTGVITQTSGFSVDSGSRAGLFKMFSTDSTPTVPSACPSSNTSLTSQTIAYIPDTDYFGNSLHGPPVPGSGSTNLWDGWLYQVNSHNSKNLGDYWSNHSTTGAGHPSNFFTSGTYSGKFRPDLSNTIGVTSMNSATNEANAIRSDTTYNITIDTVYLQGDGGDPIDRAFLQLVSNQVNIQPIEYDPNAAAYANPYYNSAQQQGQWLATSDGLQIQALFQQIASSLLRISQ